MPQALTSDGHRPMSTSVTTDVPRKAPVRHQHAHRAVVRLAGVIALVAATVATSAPAPAADHQAAVARVGSPTTWATGNGVLALDWGDLAKTPQAPRGDVVVMQSWEYAQIPALRRKHPGITILMYK